MENLSILTDIATLSNNKINSTEREAFNGLSNLKQIYLYGNDLTKLNNKMFVGLDSLEEMTLSFNKINSIEAGTFTGLRYLKELWLDNNKVLEHVTGNMFAGLNRLELLSIHTNKISKIATDLFTGLLNLREIDLDDNLITEINNGTFNSLEQLSKVWLYNNKLTTLPHNAFSGLPRPMELTLGGNPLECSSDLCWMKQGESEGWLTWIQFENRPLEPSCAGGSDWRNLTLDCPTDCKYTCMWSPPKQYLPKKLLFGSILWKTLTLQIME